MSLYDKIGGQQPNMQDMMQQLRKDPMGMAKQKGFQIPDNLAGNPQAMVMHLIQSGQVGGPMMQRIMPMIRQLTGK